MGFYGNMRMVTMLVITVLKGGIAKSTKCVYVCTCDLPIESLSSEIVVVW